ncbi:MAG: Aspartyl/glutamyl-tRNA(Asn/Gln) amidotransferase subunit C [Candidatus Curtissbacteria bacterium GW2011_GWA1_40_47]|nr:MAG: Aspartyl/glutamyl-tRNA(Asn/Gln) amidotransferase subunit C [Candidatus Curtissbacteria bacterium GW2011_GWA1_40_47]
MRNKSKSDSSLKIDINYVARLANLPLSDEEKKTFEKQLKEVLNYFSNLNEVNTKTVEPIGHITGLVDVVREDKTAPSISQEDALVNAPKTHNGFFEVEAIFEEGTRIN